MSLPNRLSKYWASAGGQDFELLAVWTPKDEDDPWARYRDILNDREYTARLEAFLTRFSPRPD
jgi:hypothetical protein